MGHMCMCLQRPEEGPGSPGTEVTGGGEPSHVSACTKLKVL